MKKFSFSTIPWKLNILQFKREKLATNLIASQNAIVSHSAKLIQLNFLLFFYRGAPVLQSFFRREIEGELHFWETENQEL